MKNYKLNAIILGIVFLCSVFVIKGQTLNKINFKTEFDFHIAGQKFKSGDYAIERINLNSDVYKIRASDGKTTNFFVLISQNGAGRQSENEFLLSFKRYGDEYFLKSIFNKSIGFRAELKRSKNEIEIARKFGEKKRTEVAVNA